MLETDAEWSSRSESRQGISPITWPLDFLSFLPLHPHSAFIYELFSCLEHREGGRAIFSPAQERLAGAEPEAIQVPVCDNIKSSGAGLKLNYFPRVEVELQRNTHQALRREQLCPTGLADQGPGPFRLLGFSANRWEGSAQPFLGDSEMDWGYPGILGSWWPELNWPLATKQQFVQVSLPPAATISREYS